MLFVILTKVYEKIRKTVINIKMKIKENKEKQKKKILYEKFHDHFFLFTVHIHMLVYERYHLSMVYQRKSKGPLYRKAE